jgi:hypothetical protein
MSTSTTDNMVSGVFATVKKGGSVFCADHWTFTKKVAVHKRGHNMSGGFKEAVVGVADGNGTLKGPVGTSGHAPVSQGDVVALMLYATATAGTSFPIAVISEVKEEVDMDNGDIVGWDATFESSGPFADF